MKKILLILLTLFSLQIQAQIIEACNLLSINGSQWYITIESNTIKSDSVQFELFEHKVSDVQDTIIISMVDFNKGRDINGYVHFGPICVSAWFWDGCCKKWKAIDYNPDDIFKLLNESRYIPTWVMSLSKYTSGYKHTSATNFRAIRIK